VPSQGGFPASDKRLDASLDENFQLLDYAGGQDRTGKRGFIPDNLPPNSLAVGNCATRISGHGRNGGPFLFLDPHLLGCFAEHVYQIPVARYQPCPADISGLSCYSSHLALFGNSDRRKLRTRRLFKSGDALVAKARGCHASASKDGNWLVLNRRSLTFCNQVAAKFDIRNDGFISNSRIEHCLNSSSESR
jgi:hypothetical protein